MLHTSFDTLSSKEPSIVTLGYFDGMHLGHQAVIERLKNNADKNKYKSIILSFSNHPASILRPHLEPAFITTFTHRTRLLQATGVDELVMLEFTKELSMLSPREFLVLLKKHANIKGLVLGYDAVFGHQRTGERSHLYEIAHELGISIEYLESSKIEEDVVSSSKIRKQIAEGNLKEVSRYLGRPYSILNTVIPGMQMGRQLGFRTANMNIEGLCLPPFGVYRSVLTVQGASFPSLVNLGIAPSIREEKTPRLEVHIPHEDALDLYGHEVEVVLEGYIRPEIKFTNIDELKAQIAKDVLVLTW